MTRRLRFTLAALMLLVPASAHPSDYSDFRIPSHSWSRFDLQLGGSYRPSMLSATNNTQSKETSGSGSFGGAWSIGHDSERLQDLLQIAGAAFGGSRTREDHDLMLEPYYFSSVDKREEQSASQDWSIQGEIRHYPWSAPFSYSGQVQAVGNYDQSWFSGSETIAQDDGFSSYGRITDNSQERWSYQYFVQTSASLGWGRVRDASGVQRALLVEDRLRHDGVLEAPLQQQTRQRIADLFYTESKFSLVHDLPDRWFWTEFERILREDPAVRPSALGAYELLHSRDPLVVSNGFDRQVGVLVGPVISLVHTNRVDRTDINLHEQIFIDDTLASEANSSSAYRVDRDDQQVRAGVQAVIEQPLGLMWHLSLASNATSDVRALDRDLQIQSALNLRYWLGERWYADGRVEQYRRTGSETQNAYQLWSVTYGATLNFFLEDHVSLGLSAIGTQQRQRYYGPATAFVRDAQIQLGISYRRGSLTAPGLMAPVRPAS